MASTAATGRHGQLAGARGGEGRARRQRCPEIKAARSWGRCSARRLTFYAPYWVVNKTGLALNYRARCVRRGVVKSPEASFSLEACEDKRRRKMPAPLRTAQNAFCSARRSSRAFLDELRYIIMRTVSLKTSSRGIE